MSLEKVNPKLAKEWNYDRNPYKPRNFTPVRSITV